jgi:hypothetical protein
MSMSVKERVNGYVDSSNFKWGLLGGALLGSVLIIAGHFAKTGNGPLLGLGAFTLTVTTGAAAYKVKRLWDAKQPKEGFVPEILKPKVQFQHGHHGGTARQVMWTRPGEDEDRADPTVVYTMKGAAVSGRRPCPTAGADNAGL